MASKYDIILITLVVVIFSVPTICAATAEEFKTSFLQLIDNNIPDLNSTQWAEAFWSIGVKDTAEIQSVKDEQLKEALSLNGIGSYTRSQLLGNIQTALRPQSSQEMHPCKNHPCQNAGTCTKKDNGQYLCQCRIGYTGENCESKTDSCKSSPCRNKGRCIEKDNGQYLCQCPPAYIGKNCETIADSNLRQDIKALIDDIDDSHMAGIDSSQLLDAFLNTGIDSLDEIAVLETKMLIPGLEGINELKISLLLKYMQDALAEKQSENDPCKSSLCQNTGTCTKKDNGQYLCQCPPAYTGKNCETEIDPCKSNTCQNEGNCTTQDNGQYLCQCPPAYTGKNCETNTYLKERLISAIKCAKNHVQNGEKINATKMQEKMNVDGLHSVEDLRLFSEEHLKEYFPKLEGRFTHARFSQELAKVADLAKTDQVCSSNPCTHDGTCEDKVCSYTCKCVHDYTGLTCEESPVDVDKTTVADTATEVVGKDKKETTTIKKPGPTGGGYSELLIALACGAVFALIGGLGYYYRQKIKSHLCNEIPYTKVKQDDHEGGKKKKPIKDHTFIY